MTIAVAPQLNEPLQPGQRFQAFNEHGHLTVAGTVLEQQGDRLLVTIDGDDGDWLVPLVRCAREIHVEPLDPFITDPFSVDGMWRSTAALRLREAYEEAAGFVDGMPPKGIGRSPEAAMLLDLLVAQEAADNAALAALLPVTPCPSWCTENGNHAWESTDPGSYTRDHCSAPSELYGDGMRLTWLEGNEWAESQPCIRIDKPAMDYGDDAISLENAATFAAEIIKMAALAGN